MVETVQFLTHIMTEGTRLKNLPELLAASGESRAMKIEREDDKDMQQICDSVVESKKRVFTMPVIIRYFPANCGIATFIDDNFQSTAKTLVAMSGSNGARGLQAPALVRAGTVTSLTLTCSACTD